MESLIHNPNISKEILNAILSRIDEGIHVVDTQGVTIYYNEVASRHDGLTVDEVIGKPLLSVFPSLNESSSTLLKVLITKKAIYNQAQVYRNIHGKKIETLNTTMPIFVGQTLVGAMEIAKDYSSLNALTDQLINLQKKWLPKKLTSKKKHRVVYTLDDFLTLHPPLIQTKTEALKVAKSHSPILIFGESGTGKEVFVQGIHYASSRENKPFIAQNCAAIPEPLLESILFGTSKGSYTGAVERPGLFELADGGTLFLDEIHAMPIDLQAKLLRVLEDGIIRRVGATTDLIVDVRVMVAMNVHPREALENKLIRTDLFYRINVLTFELIPLRKRKEDISFLTSFFIKEFNKSLNKTVKDVHKEVEIFFLNYSWPGNVRELKHTVEYMLNVTEKDVLTLNELPILLKQLRGQSYENKKQLTNDLPFRNKVELYEKQLLENAIHETNGNINQAAKLLQIPRQTLQYKLQKYNLSQSE